jgi:hypothetical protein
LTHQLTITKSGAQRYIGRKNNMNTAQVLATWTNESNFCEPRNDYYFNLHKGIAGIATGPRKHDMKLLMGLGRALPGTKVHAAYWLSRGCIFDVISCHDILPFAEYCAKVGVVPIFKFTKSKGFVRMVNHSELNEAIRAYFKTNKTI